MDNSVRRDANLPETAVVCLIMTVLSISTTIIGTVLTLLLAEFDVSLENGGLFVAVQNIGCFIGILASGALLDRFATRGVILVTLTLFILSCVVIGQSSTLVSYLVILFLMGAVFRFLDAALNVRISEMHDEKKGIYMNLLHSGFGIGAFLGPVLAGALLGKGLGWRESYLAMGAGCLVLLIVYAVLVRNKAGGSAPKAVYAPVKTASLLDGRTVTIWLALALYCGFQMGLNSWLPTFQSTYLGNDVSTAGAGVSLFWLGLIVSRLCCSFLLRYLDERSLLTIGFLVGGAFFLFGVFSLNEYALLAGCVLAGFFSGSTNPLIITLGFRWHPEAPGKISMLIFIAVTVGQIIVPWLMGVAIGLVGLQAAVVANGLLLAVAGALTLKLPGRARS